MTNDGQDLKCHNCSTINPPDQNIRQSCNSELNQQEKFEAKQKPKKSRSHKIFIFSQSILWNALLGYALINYDLLMIGIVCLIGIASIRFEIKLKIISPPPNYKKICSVLTHISVALIAVGCYFYYDAPAIEDDYTNKDLPSVPQQYAKSFILMQTLNTNEDKDGIHTTGLTVEDVKTLEEIGVIIKEKNFADTRQTILNYKDFLQEAWDHAITGRTIINELAGYEQIDDQSKLELNAEVELPTNFKSLARIYNYRLRLECENTNSDSAIAELIELDNVVKKISLNARNTIIQLISIGGQGINFKTANYIANHPKISERSVYLLYNHFKPLTQKQASFRNVFIAEYLTIKTEFEKAIRQQSANPLVWISDKRSIKINSSQRFYRNNLEEILQNDDYARPMLKGKLSVWPWNITRPQVTLNSKGKASFWYRYYNPDGSKMISQSIETAKKLDTLRTKHQIYDDLLQIVLALRLGHETDLSARAYSDKYIIDTEKKMIYSPGPDSKPFTADDIKLNINPEILGLK